MDLLNLSCQMKPEEIISNSHSFSAVPSLAILVVASAILFWLASWLVLDSKKVNWTKMFVVWLVYTGLIIGVAIFLSYAPFVVQSIKSFFTSLFT